MSMPYLPGALALVDDATVRANRLAGKAQNTQRALASHWADFENWCAAHDLQPLPCRLDALEQYLLHLVLERELTPETVERRRWAINVAHRLAGHPEPGKTEQIRLAMAGITRRFGRRAKQAAPIVLDNLAHLPNRTLADKRDRALMLLMWAGALRRSEAAAVDVEHLSPAAHGLDLLVPRSKTDQSGVGAVVAIVASSREDGPCPVRALQEWLQAAQISSGAVFRRVVGDAPAGQRLADGSINALVKARCLDMGLDPAKHSAHSLRAGSATFWGLRGKSVALIAKHGRWKNADMVIRYFRGDVGRALAGEY